MLLQVFEIVYNFISGIITILEIRKQDLLLLLPWRYSPRWAKASFFLGFHPEGFPSR
jgi:hypothetical protein